jgi:hypothetical protein
MRKRIEYICANTDKISNKYIRITSPCSVKSDGVTNCKNSHMYRSKVPLKPSPVPSPPMSRAAADKASTLPMQRHETVIDDPDQAPVAPSVVGHHGRLTQSDYDLGARKKITTSSASLLSEPVDRTHSPMISSHTGPLQVPPSSGTLPSSRGVGRPATAPAEHGSAIDVRRADSRPAPLIRSATIASATLPTAPKHGSSHPHHHHSQTGLAKSPPGVTPDDDPSFSASAAVASAAAAAYDPYDGLPPPEESMLEIDEEEGVDDDEGGEVRLLGSQEALDYDDPARGILHHALPPSHGRHPHHDSRPTDL